MLSLKCYKMSVLCECSFSLSVSLAHGDWRYRASMGCAPVWLRGDSRVA